jgi:hypothetical protein
MIPSLAMVQVGGRRRTTRLWLPLFLLWPLLLLLVVPALIVARAYGISPAGALRTSWQLVSGSRGMRIEVDGPDVAFQVRLI